MTNRTCSLCRGLGMISGICGMMTKCPVCQGKLKELEETLKNPINCSILEEEPVVLMGKDIFKQCDLSKDKKPLKGRKVNGKAKEEK